MPTTTRIHNFSAGPAVLPLPVLEEAQRHLISLPGVGMSVMEISHRSSTFEDLLNGAIEDIRALAGIPANEVLKLATIGAARIMKREGELGSITPGKFADLIAVEGDPSIDIKKLRKILVVIKDGVVYKAPNYQP